MGSDSVDEADVVGFAGQGRGDGLGGVAEDEVVDALIVAFDAEFFQKGFAFLGVELLLGAVDPAGGQAHGFGGVGEVGEHGAAVVEVGGYLAVGEDQQHHRGAVEGVEALGSRRLATLHLQVAPYLGVHGRETVAHGAVGDGDDERALLAVARGSPGAGFADLLDELAFGQLG